jgi:SAM-dependent methyltransferase
MSVATFDYSSLTVNDPSRLKRLVHRARFAHALRPLASWGADFPGSILDVGAGDGRLCLALAARFPRAELVCYEPADMLRQQAEQLLSHLPHAAIVDDWTALAGRRFDAIFCLEVLEHLPGRETRELIDKIATVAARESRVVFSVPNEIHAAGLAKGVFRMLRRYGSFDATPGNVARAALGLRPRRRPLARIAQNRRYYFHHLGFDYRRLQRMLERRFVVVERYGSPFVGLPLACNTELFFVCRKA